MINNITTILIIQSFTFPLYTPIAKAFTILSYRFYFHYMMKDYFGVTQLWAPSWPDKAAVVSRSLYWWNMILQILHNYFIRLYIWLVLNTNTAVMLVDIIMIPRTSESQSCSWSIISNFQITDFTRCHVCWSDKQRHTWNITSHECCFLI